MSGTRTRSSTHQQLDAAGGALVAGDRPSKGRRIAAMIACVIAGAAALLIYNARLTAREARLAMWSGLHNLAVSQVAYYTDNSKYFSEVPDYMHLESGAATITLTSGTDSGWSAIATHPRSSETCEMALVRRYGKEVWLTPPSQQDSYSFPVRCK